MNWGNGAGCGPLWKYEVFCEQLESPEFGTYTTYGLRVKTPEGISAIHDLSTDEAYVQRLADRFTRDGLEPLQMLDGVEDFLGRVGALEA